MMFGQGHDDLFDLATFSMIWENSHTRVKIYHTEYHDISEIFICFKNSRWEKKFTLQKSEEG